MIKSCRFSVMWISCACISFSSYAQVEQTWVQRYETAAREAPVAVKTTGSAVYVLAATNQFTNAGDLILIKYNSAGTFQWSQTYNGPGNDEDSPVAMTLDAAGNIYVVGRSRLATPNGGSTGETVTLKYNSAGALLWTAIKLRPDLFPCEPDDVAVDAFGNVYVAGSTIEGAPFAYDFMTIKYNSSGVEQWTRTYNGTGNGVDMETHIALDATGNIYVTGQSNGLLKKGIKGQKGPIVSINTFADVYTIKYNPNGGVMWQRRYDGPSHKIDRPEAIALDNAGNVYITGSTSIDQNNIDYLTMKLAGSNGAILYTAQYNGSGNRIDEATGIVVNNAGEAFVTGLSDPYGNSAYNYVTIKYTSTGAEAWTQSYNGPADGTDIANAISMDGFGFVYVTGQSQGDFGYDFATVAYGNSGIEIWRVRYNGPAAASDKAVDMAVFTPPGPAFEQSHVYVTGESEGDITGLDIALVKYEQPLVIGEFAQTTSGLSNYPNPFAESTTIEYNLAYDSDVSIKVLDAFSGKEIRTIDVGQMNAGKHNEVFKADGLRSGNYIYKIEAQSANGRYVETKFMQKK
jgi:hypothetical protein